MESPILIRAHHEMYVRSPPGLRENWFRYNTRPTLEVIYWFRLTRRFTFTSQILIQISHEAYTRSLAKLEANLINQGKQFSVAYGGHIMWDIRRDRQGRIISLKLSRENIDVNHLPQPLRRTRVIYVYLTNYMYSHYLSLGWSTVLYKQEPLSLTVVWYTFVYKLLSWRLNICIYVFIQATLITFSNMVIYVCLITTVIPFK